MPAVAASAVPSAWRSMWAAPCCAACLVGTNTTRAAWTGGLCSVFLRPLRKGLSWLAGFEVFTKFDFLLQTTSCVPILVATGAPKTALG